MVGGLRCGYGTLYTRNAGDVHLFWQGTSIGFDAGADGARTMMLVYGLRRLARFSIDSAGLTGQLMSMAVSG